MTPRELDDISSHLYIYYSLVHVTIHIYIPCNTFANFWKTVMWI